MQDHTAYEKLLQRVKSLEKEARIRKSAEAEALKTRDKLERRLKERTSELEILSSKLLSAQEEERKRIAGDLHDVIGQTLSAVKFMVETALEQMAGEKNTPGLNSLKTLVPMLQKASEEVRVIVMNLRPSILDNLGILATITWFCRQYKSVYTGIGVEKQIDITEREVPDVLKTIIFRILQEAMNNIAKHSRADKVHLCLGKTDSTVELIIRDNGVGFAAGKLGSIKASDNGFGITSMKERAELSGGRFEIKSNSGDGTVIKAAWNSEKIRTIS